MNTLNKQGRNEKVANIYNHIFKHIYHIIFIENIDMKVVSNHSGMQAFNIEFYIIMTNLNINLNNKT